MLVGGDLPGHYRVIFEGQLVNPDTTREKVQHVLNAGLKPVIIVVHARPENALENTFKRFNETGRGASINVMSNIQGGISASLREVHRQFGDAVEFKVYDDRDRNNPTALTGWDHLTVLESEGNHDQINQRLRNALEQHQAAGTISDATYRQASGSAPLDHDASLGPANHEQHETHGAGRGLPARDRQKAVIAGVQPETHKATADPKVEPSSELSQRYENLSVKQRMLVDVLQQKGAPKAAIEKALASTIQPAQATPVLATPTPVPRL